jgi:hypothetical protein
MKPGIMIRVIYAALLMILNFGIRSQSVLTWDELAQVRFENKYDTALAIEIQTAEFSDHLRSYEGKDVVITGYMIPIDPLGTRYVLSRFPNANCFFCGNAGPETIVDLRLLPQFVRRYDTDTYAIFRGTLQLHQKNLESFNYVLLNAEKM